MKHRLGFLGCATVFCLACALLLWADTTSDLHPVADGGVEQWTNNAGTSCASTTCFTEVDEDVVAACTGVDSIFNKSGTTAGNTQTYDVSLSSIPDNSLLTSTVVQGCVVRGTTTNSNFRFKVRIDGVVTDCPTTTLVHGQLTFVSCTIDHPDVTKQSATDFEIGWEITGTAPLKGENIEAQITYASPSGAAKRRTYVARVRPVPGHVTDGGR